MIRLGRPSLLARNGVTQQMALPERNSRLTPVVAHPLDAPELPDVPVFVVADADERLALQAPVGREHVAVRAIGHVVAVLLEPVRQRELERQELARAERERIVDDACVLRLAAIGPVEADVGPGPLVALGMGVERVVVRPAVVGLPGVVGALEEDVGRAIVADDEDDVALPVGLVVAVGERREPSQVDAAGPVAAESSAGVARLPPALVQVLGAGRRGPAGPCPRSGPSFFIEPRTAAAVIAHAEDLDPEPPRRVGRDHDVDRLAGLDALLRAVALDPGRAEAVPVGADAVNCQSSAPGLAVLVADQERNTITRDCQRRP